MRNKKAIIIILVLLLIVLSVGIYFMFFNNKKEKINVYLFWGNGCPHCEHAKEFFSSIEQEYSKYYNLIDYEVWYDEENNNLKNKVDSELDANATGVPFIVIGEEYVNGYSSAMDNEIKEIIINQYENYNYIDIVQKVK